VISIIKIILVALLLKICSPVWSSELIIDSDIVAKKSKGAMDRMLSTIANDYHTYYEYSKFNEFLFALAVSGTLANSDLDQEIFQDLLHDDLNSHSSNKVFNQFNNAGGYSQLRYAVPFYFASMLAGNALSESSTDNVLELWGSNALRTVILGAPQQLFFSYATGGQRPSEGDSNWDLFNGDNGVSGHAFYGAVPFLTAAQLTSNNYIKTSWIIASMLPGLSRVNNNKHYMSQVFLGWSLALVSSNAVFQVDYGLDIKITPLVSEDGMLVGIQYRF
jgi:hypothetical protein